MRFEAKNSYFKQLGQTIGNFKNIAKTLPTRHQKVSCYLLTHDDDSAYSDHFTVGKSKYVRVCLCVCVCVEVVLHVHVCHCMCLHYMY